MAIDDVAFEILIKKFARAAAAGDATALAALFTSDGVYDDYFFGPYQGEAAMAEMLAHFAEGGRDFRWEFFAPVASADRAYASYRFSYTSTHPDAKAARVTFDGMARFELEAGRIKRYSEVFDRGMALAQQNYAPERIAKICARYGAALKARPEWVEHL
jgi:ketosteroid isomerase-like protein